ncbi:MAG: gamma-glutamyltransferase [Pseudomonadota bacterium]
MTSSWVRVGFICLLLWHGGALGASGAKPRQNAIASAHPAATAAGREVIEKGGNAFDAAVAVAAALAVVEPYASGIGGGGFFLLHREADGFATMVDGRETAPQEASRDMYLDDDGEFVRSASLNGPLAAGIPGLPAALAHIQNNYGQLSLSDTLAPAIRLAREGFAIGPRYSRMAGFRAQAFSASPDGSEIFLKEGAAPAPGAIIKQPDLAKTLGRLAAQGHDGFYRGELAQRLVSGTRAAGGIWTLDDLASYTIVERDVLEGRFHDLKVISAPPPSSGGVALIQALKILERFDYANSTRIDRIHFTAEAMRHAYRDRAQFLGDPDFIDVPVAWLTSDERARQWAERIKPERAGISAELPPIDAPRGSDTTHFSVFDAAGNLVAATLSVNYPFGATFVPPGTGVLLNNEMDDFSAKAYTPNAYGLIGAEANAIAPGKRPLSSMTPTFLVDDDRVAVIGTPGGSRIISMVLIGTLEFAMGGDAQAIVDAKRFHHQYVPDELQFEKNGFSAQEQTALQGRGHVLKERSRNYGNMHVVTWSKKTGAASAASDKRGEGGWDVW